MRRLGSGKTKNEYKFFVGNLWKVVTRKTEKEIGGKY